jgi:uncharacterized protein (DUF58 family)
MLKHVFRISALIVPSLAAWMVAIYHPHRDELTRTVSEAFGPVWVAIFVCLCARAVALVLARLHDDSIEVVPRLDVLSSAGASLAWLSSFAVMGAVKLGWASLGAVGLLGFALLHIVVLYTLIVHRDTDALRGGTITRKLAPENVNEGEDVKEEVALNGVKIPLGFRLFMKGRVGPRFPESRYVLEAQHSDAEIALESDLGEAHRGEHDAELLEMWFEDTFGICKTHPIKVGAAKLTVMPKVGTVDRKIRPLLQHGLGPKQGKPTMRIPTEGVMDMREYRDGDDVRRIHWVRSLAAGQLIVRLPDEIPPDRPKVRLVLDTFFPEAEAFDVPVKDEVLDAMVQVWLGVARALAERGTRVTMVTAAPHDNNSIVTKRFEYVQRAAAIAQTLGANVKWQNQIQVEQLLTDEATFVVANGVHMVPPSDPRYRWIIVMPSSVTQPEWDVPNAGRTPFPLGHPENRWGVVQKRVAAITTARRDHEKALAALSFNLTPPPPGSLIAMPVGNEVRLEPVR